MDEKLDVAANLARGGNDRFVHDCILSPHPETTFDEDAFKSLLAGSRSLSPGEKQRIIDAVPRLSQFQIDELMRIISEEIDKFKNIDRNQGFCEATQRLRRTYASSGFLSDQTDAGPEPQKA